MPSLPSLDHVAGVTQPVTTLRLAGHRIRPTGVAVIALGLSLVLLVPRMAWRAGRLAVTAVHEAGHAVVAVVAGRKVTAVHLRSDASGLTVHRGTLGRGGRLVTAAAGYPAPGAAGAAGAWLVANRAPTVWLAVLAGGGVAMAVLWVRNLFGLALMAAWVAGLGWLLAAGSPGADALLGAVMAWYLALGGLRAAMELFGVTGPSDATELGRLVHLPASVCTVLFALVSALGAVTCGWLLLGGR